MQRPIRFVGLSTALANAHDLADWLGTGSSGLFNFKPSVRPVQLEVHMQGFPGGTPGCVEGSGAKGFFGAQGPGGRGGAL